MAEWTYERIEIPNTKIEDDLLNSYSWAYEYAKRKFYDANVRLQLCDYASGCLLVINKDGLFYKIKLQFGKYSLNKKKDKKKALSNICYRIKQAICHRI